MPPTRATESLLTSSNQEMIGPESPMPASPRICSTARTLPMIAPRPGYRLIEMAPEEPSTRSIIPVLITLVE